MDEEHEMKTKGEVGMDTFTRLTSLGIGKDDIQMLVRTKIHSSIAWDKCNQGKSGKDNEDGKEEGKGKR
eukprot:12417853-Karenia_brevis.AAC.1